MTEHREVPLPAAPTATEWERFLRAERSTDDNPIALTEREVSRIQWICAAVCDRQSPDHEAALGQLAVVSGFLGALITETANGPGSVAPSSAERWAQLEATPYYLRNSSHVKRLEDLKSRGLDPYGNPLDT